MAKELISFVLPVTLNENMGANQASSWRSDTDTEIKRRLKLLLKSFMAMFDQRDLAAFALVCPANDLPEVTELVRLVTTDRRFQVIPELEMCQEIEVMLQNALLVSPGWHIQQLIKLSYAEFCTTDYYVTLDSDIVCRNRFSAANLIDSSRAVAGIETLNDYQRIYVDGFAERELGVKQKRYRRSAKFLDYERPPALQQIFYSETPVVLHTASVRALTDHISSLSNRYWGSTLGHEPGWTEYALYFQYLEMTNQLEQVYKLGDCNSILDLERSIWQPTIFYRHPRRYDESHFLKGRPEHCSGKFIAVQSWLRLSDWLPERYESLDGFYADLESWIL